MLQFITDRHLVGVIWDRNNGFWSILCVASVCVLLLLKFQCTFSGPQINRFSTKYINISKVKPIHFLFFHLFKKLFFHTANFPKCVFWSILCFSFLYYLATVGILWAMKQFSYPLRRFYTRPLKAIGGMRILIRLIGKSFSECMEYFFLNLGNGIWNGIVII